MKNENIFRKILKYFLRGLIYTVPLIVTLYVIYQTFIILDELIPLDQILPFNFPGLGMIIVLAIVTLFGVLGSSFIADPIRKYIERLLEKIPLVKTIYVSIRDLLSAFVGEKKRFNKPVLVQISRDEGIEKLGFITDEDLRHLGISDDKIAVYLPHSYNFSGNLFIVSKKRVTPIDQSASEVMKFIVSGGVAKPEEDIHKKLQ